MLKMYTLHVTGTHCASCKILIEDVLGEQEFIKKAQVDLLNITFGLIVIAGGVIIAFGKVNLGSLVASMGLVFELIKLEIGDLAFEILQDIEGNKKK